MLYQIANRIKQLQLVISFLLVDFCHQILKPNDNFNVGFCYDSTLLLCTKVHFLDTPPAEDEITLSLSLMPTKFKLLYRLIQGFSILPKNMFVRLEGIVCFLNSEKYTEYYLQHFSKLSYKGLKPLYFLCYQNQFYFITKITM